MKTPQEIYAEVTLFAAFVTGICIVFSICTGVADYLQAREAQKREQGHE